VGHPFDTMKTRMQMAAVNAGLWQTIREFGGVTSLFRGMSAPLFAASAINGTGQSCVRDDAVTTQIN
jgi:Mitochondrial carrier protein